MALGSNLGDRPAHLAVARDQLALLPGSELIAVSEIEETAPLGPIPQGPYLNQMALLRTSLSAHELLDHCHRIERGAGRVHRVRWGPRTLDLDLVRFGGHVVVDPDLTLPHPEIPHRSFWQRELAELEAQRDAWLGRRGFATPDPQPHG